MTLCRLLALAALLALLAPAGSWAADPTPQTQLEEGMKAFQRGAVDDAAQRWAAAAEGFRRAGKKSEQALALIHLARAYSALGAYRQAVLTLNDAFGLATQTKDAARLVAVLSARGAAQAALGHAEAAEADLRLAVTTARKAAAPAMLAGALNDLANLTAAQGKYKEAVPLYREAIAAAEPGTPGALTARALTNAAVAMRKQGDAAQSITFLDRAWQQTRGLAPSRDVAFALTSLGVAYRDTRAALPGAPPALLVRASEVLTEAGTMADNLGDRRSASYAWGYLGGLYEAEQRWDDALQLTRTAVLNAQQANAPESLYRWEWQAGRLLKRAGSVDDSIEAYRRAVRILQTIRPELSVGVSPTQSSFRESVGPVYFELVDLLLQRAGTQSNTAAVAPLLIEARESVELLKAAELRDYFRDDCVDSMLSKVTTLDSLATSTVIVYPIILADRLELLASLPGGLKRVTVPVSSAELTQEVRRFRLTLEKRTTRQYLPHARKLYDWLVRPLTADLEANKIDTLIFVPDGALRTVPMAALHDGNRFLVSKYALGITPGLSLTDPRPLRRDSPKVLAVGVTEPVQGFPPLPSVGVELKALQTIYKSTTLVDREFRVGSLERTLKDEQYNIVHIASHGQFGSDINDTFLLAFDNKVTLDRLDQLVGLFKFRDEPLELLTLSACDTAAGDDRAALGLAGVAIKAGARSALATLWNVNDDASAELVVDFYRELQSGSRAVALQRAQVKMLSDPRYEHPGFWAPFLLINNWL